jgi:membrane protein DedA with SNARE-associated domain
MESFLTHAGYAAIVIFGFLEACCIPISSEVTFGFAGILAFQGHLNLVLVIIIGTLAELAGSYVSYGVGRIGGRPLVDRFGKYVLVTRKDVDRAERFFEGRGAWVVPVGRALPVIRAFVSIVAGLAGVPAAMFGVLSLIGTVVYVIALSVIGYELGSAWHNIQHYISVGGYVIVAAVVLLIVGFVLYRLREVRKEAAAEQAAQNSRPGQPAQDSYPGHPAQDSRPGQPAQDSRPGQPAQRTPPADQPRGPRHAAKE